jgi:serine/threonine protein kinase
MEVFSTDQIQDRSVKTEAGNLTAKVDRWNGGYEYLLGDANIAYEKNGIYLIVGEYRQLAGWIIFISSVHTQFPVLLKTILPELIRFKVTFTIPENSFVYSNLMEGGLGYDQVGKIISLYPENESDASDLATSLVQLTQSFNGPIIPTAKHLGGCIYAEYRNSTGYKTNVKWPFVNFKANNRLRASKWLNRKYFLYQCLKNDVKGNVYKSLDFSKWNDIKWCIVKQGNNFQCFDNCGRDISDRLRWQHEMLKVLNEKINVPAAIDYIKTDWHSYLVMEMIDGISLYEAVNIQQQGKHWVFLDDPAKLQVIGYLIQIADLIGNMHSLGYVHRDLNPMNFMVTNDQKVVAIDVELCYNFKEHLPDPAFSLGTEGYMSPAQRIGERPEIADDIFGIGGLLLRAFTGISPTKFNKSEHEALYNNLQFFINNHRLSAMICSCFNQNPQTRPSLKSIKHNLDLYYSLILTGGQAEADEKRTSATFDSVKTIVNKAIETLWNYPLLGKNNLWYSKTVTEQQVVANGFNSLSWYPGLYNGSSGIIYTLAIAESSAFNLECGLRIIEDNLSQLKKIQGKNSEMAGGFFYGSPGLGLITALLIRNNFIEKSIIHLDNIWKLLNGKSSGLNLSEGIAGQALAMMYCSELLKFPGLESEVSKIIATIVKAQNTDGSWSIKKSNSGNKVKLTGLFHGTAGIIYVLLIYASKMESIQAKRAAKKGLMWLIEHKKNNGGHSVWPVNSMNQTIDPWVEHGFSGIALTFIKAYEVFHDPKYKEIAQSALTGHPKFIISNYLSHANGISGLGEVYLEAFRVFGEDEWRERAAHIAAILQHIYYLQSNDTFYWIDGNEAAATADFMTGQSGAIHFLLRYLNPEKIHYPFISI